MDHVDLETGTAKKVRSDASTPTTTAASSRGRGTSKGSNVTKDKGEIKVDLAAMPDNLTEPQQLEWLQDQEKNIAKTSTIKAVTKGRSLVNQIANDLAPIRDHWNLTRSQIIMELCRNPFGPGLRSAGALFGQTQFSS